MSTSGAPRVRLALDAMGGDFGPSEAVAGAALAVQDGGLELLLVGDQDAIAAELAKLPPGQAAGLVPVPSQGVIQEGESPVHALRQNPKASIAVAGGLVQSGKAVGLVSMGSTGASVAVAAFTMGVLEGLVRPALGGPVFGLAPKTILVDLGSNVDTRPAQLVQFAALGVALANVLLGIPQPRVGLLNVGSEEGKGNRQTKEAYQLLKSSGLTFAGNVEGHELVLPPSKADVVVCDGFVGNVILKLVEGSGAVLAARLRQLLADRLPADTHQALSHELDALFNVAERFGGAPLLGVNGIAVVGHGRARATTIAQAIRTARRCVEMRLVDRMREQLERVKPALRLDASQTR
ncbi:MAG: phosphate acyltransferase PlsX [Dehalococcoidia bacterium]|nr:phosphate acyltransferase PlsX [Dehalococcoidia bacterium]